MYISLFEQFLANNTNNLRRLLWRLLLFGFLSSVVDFGSRVVHSACQRIKSSHRGRKTVKTSIRCLSHVIQLLHDGIVGNSSNVFIEQFSSKLLFSWRIHHFVRAVEEREILKYGRNSFFLFCLFDSIVSIKSNIY